MKKIYLLSLLSVFSLNLYCQVFWEKHPDNPVMVPDPAKEWEEGVNGANSVLYYNNTYHMWYTGSWYNPRIGHATSPDGITWTKDTNDPVLDVGPDGDWDDNWVMGGDVIVIDSIFHIWYTGHDGSNNYKNARIGHATSPDGVNWTKDTVNNPVLDLGPSGDWDDSWAMGSSVVYDGSEYHLWYSACNSTAFKYAIGHATSPDGVNWTKDTLNPVLTYETGKWDSPQVQVSSVIFDGNTYHMWYHAGDWWNENIGYATSEDGSVWTKYGNNPVLRKGSEGSWESNFVSYPSVIDSAGIKYKMWYLGSNAAEKGSIGYAESLVPPWKQMESMDIERGNPVSCAIDTMIYVFGGYTPSVTLSSARAYNTITNEWSNLATMPEGLYYGNAEVVNGKIYLIGGWSNTGGWHTINSTMEYDPGGDSWQGKTGSPTATGSNASCVLKDTIYILGGAETAVSQDNKKARYYAPGSDSWGSLPDMIYDRPWGASAVTLDNKIYVIGGTYESGGKENPTGKLEVYDPQLKTWTEMADLPVHAIDHISVVHDQKILVFGGDSATIIVNVSGGFVTMGTNVIQEYDPSTDSWRLLENMPFKRSSMAGEKVGNFVYLLGGYLNGVPIGDPLSEVWRFDLESPNPFNYVNISHIRFGSTGDPLNGLTVTWKSNGTSDSIAWGYTSNLEQGNFKGFRIGNNFGITFNYAFPAVTAGSTIYYALYDSKGGKWTEESTFKAASDATNNQFSFSVIGDSRTYPDEWKIISEAVLETDFTLFMGDVIADGSYESDWNDWFEYGEKFVSREPIYHCIGNHDEDNSTSGFDTYLSMFTLPGEETYYSFNYGNAVFICLNTEDPGNTAQYSWLDSTLKANEDKTWKIVFFHRPFYTSPSHVGEMDPYFNTWWKAFDDYGVDLIFNGHTHNYQRTKPINRNISTTTPVFNYGGKGMGRCQIVAGSAGPLSPAATSGLWWLERSESIRHFCDIQIDGGLLTLKAMDANQVVFDEFVIDKSIDAIRDFRSPNSWIYPNPTNDLITIETAKPGQHSIDITSLNGQLLYSTIMEGPTHQIDMSSFEKGLYFITVRSRDYVRTQKIIKQ